MDEPGFWWRAPGLAAALLSPVALLYGAVAAWRMRGQGRDPGLPVLCIGNFSSGGAGKTPTALALGAALQAAGARPFVLTRGYGGRLRGPLRVDPQAHAAADVGDEPLLLARRLPTVVARDRVAGAALAREIGARVIVMDDGLQNPSLRKTCAVAVVDGTRGVGNGRVLPAGPLRAPLDVQLLRTDALLVIGPGANAAALIARAQARGIPLFRGALQPDAAALARLRGQKLLAFAGIGDPGKFFRTLADAGLDVAARRAFADHHVYSAAEAAALLAHADRDGLTPVTTEKDLARMAGNADLAALAARAQPLPVTLAVEDMDGLMRFVREKLGLG
jgi:tetraacyldisaccharide 4'-kinase